MELLIKSILLSTSAKDWLLKRFEQHLTLEQQQQLQTKSLTDYNFNTVLQAFFDNEYNYWFLQHQFNSDLTEVDYKFINLANNSYIIVVKILMYLILTKSDLSWLKLKLVKAISYKITNARKLGWSEQVHEQKQLLI